MRTKKILRSDTFRYLTVSVIAAALYLLLRKPVTFKIAVSDAFFVMAAIHILLGGTHYIHNVGLFKTFSYMNYKRHFRKEAKDSTQVHPMSLAEYTEEVVNNEMNHKPVGLPLAIGLGFTVVSFLAALI